MLALAVSLGLQGPISWLFRHLIHVSKDGTEVNEFETIALRGVTLLLRLIANYLEGRISAALKGSAPAPIGPDAQDAPGT